MPALIIIGIGYAGLCAFALAAFALAGRADDAADQALGKMRGERAGSKAGGGSCTKASPLGESHYDIAHRVGAPRA